MRKDIDAFKKRFARVAMPCGGSAFWWVEMQQRGVPHLHIITVGLSAEQCERLIRGWLEITAASKSGYAPGLPVGQYCEPVREGDAVCIYAAKEVSKRLQKDGWTGRTWGVWCERNFQPLEQSYGLTVHESDSAGHEQYERVTEDVRAFWWGLAAKSDTPAHLIRLLCGYRTTGYAVPVSGWQETVAIGYQVQAVVRSRLAAERAYLPLWYSERWLRLLFEGPLVKILWRPYMGWRLPSRQDKARGVRPWRLVASPHLSLTVEPLGQEDGDTGLALQWHWAVERELAVAHGVDYGLERQVAGLRLPSEQRAAWWTNRSALRAITCPAPALLAPAFFASAGASGASRD